LTMPSPQKLIDALVEAALARHRARDPGTEQAQREHSHAQEQFEAAEAALREALAISTQAEHVMTSELRDLVTGMSVSVDVSTGDCDNGRRLMGTVTEVMDDAGDKHGVTLLVQDAEPNWLDSPRPAAQFKVLAQALDHLAACKDPARLSAEAHAAYVADASVMQSWCNADGLRALLTRALPAWPRG
jgi:hypothetical protein